MQPRAWSIPALLTLILLFVLTWLAAGPLPGAGAARYAVSQCGWKVGHDGNWLDTSADKFNRSSWCGVPAGSDAWEGVHMTSGTRGSTSAVGGTKFARWRWNSPPGTGIVNVSGDRWHVLRDNFQHRIGTAPAGGNFSPFAEYSSTDTDRTQFSRYFTSPVGSFESRLLCALPSERFCSVTGTSLAGLRGLTFTVEDNESPSASLSGAFRAGTWLRAAQEVEYSGTDRGSGLRFTETLVDGTAVAETEHSCEKAKIAGQWRGTQMQPCRTGADGNHTVDTAKLSDGPHRITGCAIDFAGNRGCSDDATILTDNTAPSAPRGLAVTGGDGWHRTNSFALTWTDPDQGVAAPIVGSRHRITGPDGFDTGAVATAGESGGGPEAEVGHHSAGLTGLTVRSAGEYQVLVWLVDAAGNENPAASAEATLRFDDVEPEAFLLHPESGSPELLRAEVRDEHSGPAGGSIEYRRQGSEAWRELPTRFDPQGARAELEADFPSDKLRPGTYAIRTVVRDQAGNRTVSYQRSTGARLILRAPLKQATRLETTLRGPGVHGRSIQVPFGRKVRLVGRLLGQGGGGVAGRQVTVTQLPAAGSRASRTARLIRTGPGGRFSLLLGPGTSRRINVAFNGDGRFSASTAPGLRLGVRGSISFSASPKSLKTGQRVRLRGVVRAGAARQPSRGSLVAIRYFERSSRAWRPVLVTRTDGSGRYRASYRFRYITGLARIRLRATLLPAQRFPYLPANSPVTGVRVRG